MREESSNALRRPLLGLLLFGLLGTAVELVLLRHDDDGWTILPFVVSAFAGIATLARLVRPVPASVRWLWIAMVLLVAEGVPHVGLHYAGGLEFQTEMDPTMSRSQRFWNVLHMPAPPALAPGILMQLGLLGLISTYRDPLVSATSQLSSR